MMASVDVGKEERLRKIRELLNGSDSEEEETPKKSKSQKAKKKKGKGKGKNQAGGGGAAGAGGGGAKMVHVDDTFDETNGNPPSIYDQVRVSTTESGTIIIETVAEYDEREEDYEYDYEAEFHEGEYNDEGDELEMFGDAKVDAIEGEEDEEEENAYSSDSEIEFGLRKAIGIDDEDVANYSVEQDPENGSQFLIRAMLESKKLPKIAVADPEVLKARLAAKVNPIQELPIRYQQEKPKRVRKKKERALKDMEMEDDESRVPFAISGTPADTFSEDEPTNGDCASNCDRDSNEEIDGLPIVATLIKGEQLEEIGAETLSGSGTEGSSSDEDDDHEKEGDGDEVLGVEAKGQMPTAIVKTSTWLPTTEWEARTLHEFRRLRTKVDRQRQALEAGKWRIPLPNNMRIPEGEGLPEWFRFCFGSRIEFSASSGKFRKPAPKITPRTTVETFCREYLDEFFPKTDADTHESRSSNFQAGVEAETEAEVTARMNSLSLEAPTTLGIGIDSTEPQPQPVPVPYNGYKPLLTILLNIPQRVLERLIASNVKWLSENYGQFINTQQCEWLYSLLVCLQLPVEASVVSDLRDIVRACKKQRKILAQVIGSTSSHLAPGGAEGQEEDEDSQIVQMYLNSLNLFITLVGNYFGQRDLLEEF